MSEQASIFIRRLADKWHEVPVSRLERASTRDLAAMPDDQLLSIWERARAETSDGLRGLQMRGWFHRVYDAWLAGRKVLEVGPGLGIDGVALARLGCRMTFVDVSTSNLELVARIFALHRLRAPQLLTLDTFDRIDHLDEDYDAVVAFGSLHHIPAEVGKPEFEALGRRLKPGGRFIMHAYPLQRWLDEGQLPFSGWGEKTDGPGTPWAEWYDTKKLLGQLYPSAFAPLLYCEYHSGAMNCIDLIKTEGDSELRAATLPSSARLAPGVVRVDELCVQTGWDATATVEESGAVLVTTPSEPWAYAALAPIHVDRLRDGIECFSLRIIATVCEGRVGVGVPSPDGRSMIAEEYLSSELGGPQSCIIDVDTRTGTSGLVIVRNAARRSGRSRILVHSLELFSA